MNIKYVLLHLSLIVSPLSAMNTKHGSELRSRKHPAAPSACSESLELQKTEKQTAVELERAKILVAAFRELPNKKNKVTTEHMKRMPFVVQQRIAEFFAFPNYKMALIHLVCTREKISKLLNETFIQRVKENLTEQYNRWRVYIPQNFKRCIVGYQLFTSEVFTSEEPTKVFCKDFKLTRNEEYPIERLYSLPKSVPLPEPPETGFMYGVVLYSDGSQEQLLELSKDLKKADIGCRSLAFHLYSITNSRPKVVLRTEGKIEKDVCCPVLINDFLKNEYQKRPYVAKKIIQKNYPFIFTDVKEMAKLQLQQATLALRDTTLVRSVRIEQAAHWLRTDPCLSMHTLAPKAITFHRGECCCEGCKLESPLETSPSIVNKARCCNCDEETLRAAGCCCLCTTGILCTPVVIKGAILGYKFLASGIASGIHIIGTGWNSGCNFIFGDSSSLCFR